MRFFLLFFILFAFLGELTLDCSTAFVRSEIIPAGSHSSPFSQDGNPETQKIILGSSAHAALPLSFATPSVFWISLNNSTGFGEFLIPILNPPTSRIERPPIV